MTKDEFAAAFALGQAITEHGVRTTIAQEKRKGRLVMIHELATVTPEEQRRIADLIQRLGPEDSAQIIANIEVEGEARLITKFVQGFTSLPEWLEGAAGESSAETDRSPAAAEESSPSVAVAPEGRDQLPTDASKAPAGSAEEQAPEPSFTELFLKAITPQLTHSQPREDVGADRPPEDDTGSFLSTFGITAPTPPAPTAPLATPAAPPSAATAPSPGQLAPAPAPPVATSRADAPPRMPPAPNDSQRLETTRLPLGESPASSASGVGSSLSAPRELSSPPSAPRDAAPRAEESSGGFTDLFSQSAYRPNVSRQPPGIFPTPQPASPGSGATPEAPVLNLEALGPDIRAQSPASESSARRQPLGSDAFAGLGDASRPPNENAPRQLAPVPRAQSPDAMASNYSAALTPARAHIASPALPPPSAAKPPPPPASSFLPVILTVVVAILVAVATIVVFAVTAR